MNRLSCKRTIAAVTSTRAEYGLLRGLLHFPISMNAHRSPALCGEEQRRQA